MDDNIDSDIKTTVLRRKLHSFEARRIRRRKIISLCIYLFAGLSGLAGLIFTLIWCMVGEYSMLQWLIAILSMFLILITVNCYSLDIELKKFNERKGTQ